MPKIHDKFHTIDGKRRVLVADDEIINRQLLKKILGDDYEVLFACDGAETMEMIRNYQDTLSLVLLDILMPVKSGLEVLQELGADSRLSQIPIIVVTAEQDTEVESLDLGAIDFIPKPYPAAEVIKARVRRTIELSEDREIISYTERDELSGLFTKKYFFRYIEQFDHHHKDTEMDAIVVDVNHFHMINERYGRAYGDNVLRRIGEYIREMLKDSDGFACRGEADAFLIYCPHRDDYEKIMENAAISLTDEETSGNRVRLRMGVYYNADKTIDVERRFDRAKMAADTVRGSFAKTIGVYDNDLHERQLYAEQLIEEFSKAIAENQFQVYYQPKFDVRPDTPILSSAEALVRWIHPELGMISPGVFIPLFEDNGLIQKLDTFVWEQTAKQIAEWKARFDFSIPVSVNVSRIDMYDPDMSNVLQKILEKNGLTTADLLLEVTESAYTQDSEQIIRSVEGLQELGFKIEMDDFGTGYSSLNMISTLPIDALKLDMQFIRNAFKEGGDTHLLEVIIGLSKYLSVPVIAEGVETEQQLNELKKLGCDIVQGYFFSKPVPAVEFEPFILQKKEAEKAAAEAAALERERKEGLMEADEVIRQMKLDAIRGGRPDSEEEEEKEIPSESRKEHTGLQLRTATAFFAVLAILAAIALMISNVAVTKGYQRMEAASDRYISAQMAASDMESGSDYLTDRVRCFVVTGEQEYLQDFNEEVMTTKRRDLAVENLEKLLQGKDKEALENLNTALNLSNELVGIENHAMRLMLDTGNYERSEVPQELAEVKLSPEELAMTSQEKRARAQQMVFDNEYMHYKDRIRENVRLCTHSLIQTSSQELENASAKLSLLVNLQTFITILFLLIVFGIVLLISRMVRRPLTEMVTKMQLQEPAEPTGVEELRFVTRTYNKILRDNKEANDRLSHEAAHDALTGLFNRGAYDLLMESADTEHMALLLIDVDYFKQVNDTYGHAVGDKVLKRVADILRSSFRSVDILCRIGGDEFAVVMTRVNSSMSQLVLNKISHANDLLQHPKDDLPPVSLSVGVAFSDRENPQGDIFKDADTALYDVKRAGRKGCKIF